MNSYTISELNHQVAVRLVVENHYMHRRPPISFAFGLYNNGVIKGVITFGTPASHHMLKSASPFNPASVIELNRLWVADELPRNTESWFISKVLARLPARIVLSYADTAFGHVGYVYRAANFNYSGWTDMDRKTPRFDYVTPGAHSRDAFRNGEIRFTDRVRRRPKVRYWTVTGNKTEKKKLDKECCWLKLDWKLRPPPLEHERWRA